MYKCKHYFHFWFPGHVYYSCNKHLCHLMKNTVIQNEEFKTQSNERAKTKTKTSWDDGDSLPREP